MFILLRFIKFWGFIFVAVGVVLSKVGCVSQRVRNIRKSISGRIGRGDYKYKSPVSISIIFPFFPLEWTQKDVFLFLFKLCCCFLAFFFIVVMFLLIKIYFWDYRYVFFKYMKLYYEMKKLDKIERQWVEKVQLSESRLRDVSLDLVRLEYHKGICSQKDKKLKNYIKWIDLTLKEYYKRKQKYQKQLAIEEIVLFEVLVKSSEVKKEIADIEDSVNKGNKGKIKEKKKTKN